MTKKVKIKRTTKLSQKAKYCLESFGHHIWAWRRHRWLLREKQNPRNYLTRMYGHLGVTDGL